MNNTISVVVWCAYNAQTAVTELRVIQVDTNEDVPLPPGSFLIRISTDKRTQRYFIHHINSGRETYLQGNAKFRAFVKEYLLQTSNPGTGFPDSSKE